MGLLSYMQRQRQLDAEEAARQQYQSLLGQAPQTALAPQEGPVRPAGTLPRIAQRRQGGLLEGAEQEGPVRPAETLLPIMQTTQGSGLLGGQISPQEFIGRTAGMPGNLGQNTINAVKEGLLGNSQAAPFGGTGMDAQTYNQLIQYNQKKQAGIPTKQTEDMAYNLAYQRASRPQRFMDPSGQMIEYPGADLSGFTVPPGMSKKGRETLGKKPMAAESASKLAMVDTAKFGTELIEPILFNDDGKVNKDAVKGMWSINLFEPSAALASEDSQKLFIAFEWGKQAITRTETGAAMPATEVRNTAKRFMPKPWDSDDVVKLKWAAYNLFLSNAEDYLDPANLTADAIFNKAMADAKKTQGKPQKGKQQKVIDYKDLP